MPGRMTPDPSGYDDGRADHKLLLREIQQAAAAIESLLSEVNSVQLSVNTLKTRAEANAEELRLLSKMLRDGDGTGNSVMTRLAIVERSIGEMRDGLTRADDVRARQGDTTALARWTVWASIIGGFISLVGAIVAVVIAVKFGKP